MPEDLITLEKSLKELEKEDKKTKEDKKCDIINLGCDLDDY